MAETIRDFSRNVLLKIKSVSEGQIQIFPHARVDGDCLGTAVALALSLKKMGKDAKVMTEWAIPPRLQFMNVPEEILTIVNAENTPENLKIQAVAFAVDCSEGSRMGPAEELYEKAETKIVLDHHISSSVSGDLAYVDGTSASCAELLYLVLKAWEEDLGVTLMDQQVADCLMVGIQSDSGKFSYENTKPSTLRIAADLMERGANLTDNAYHLFDETSEGKVRLHGLALSNMKLYADGRIAITKITRKMMEETGAPEGAADGIVNILRDIDTVMASFVVRENDNGVLRANCRTKVGFDAAEFAQKMGGGGHHRASGFGENDMDIDSFMEKIVKEATAFLNQA